MEREGIALAVLVALLWGTADLLGARAAGSLGTLKATLISQTFGLLLVLAFGSLARQAWQIPLSVGAIERSALLGLLSGGWGALGYLALYRALNLGPMALVSPLSSTSSAVTLLLALFLLHERLSPLHLGCVVLVILGVVLASTNGTGLMSWRGKPVASWFRRGIPWAIGATLAFGFMDFGIGASATISNWLLPVVWTRLFSVLTLALIALCMRQASASSGTPVATVSSGPSLARLPGPHGQGRVALSLRDDLPCKHVPLQLYCFYRSKQTRGRLYRCVDAGLLFAGAAGLAENAAVLGFSLATRLTTTGVTSAIASGYALVVMLYGLLACHERLTRNQVSGLALFMGSLILLTL